jgi:hypothetical protein
MPDLAPDFEHDVFMSYAHGRRPGRSDAPLRDWSQKFIDLLQDEIYALHPDIGAIDVWDDRNVDPTAALTDEIKREVERSRVLLIIMSPRYLESKWCREELDWFKGQFLGRRRSPGRVFVVRAVSTNTDGWPDFLKDSRGHPDIGFQFHPETTEVSVPPFCWPDLKSRTDEFNKSFYTLRTTLVRRLQAIKGRTQLISTGRPASIPQRISGRQLLYLHAASGADGVRAEVESELREEGYRIVSPVPQAAGSSLADWQAEPKERVRAVARYCDALTVLRATDDPAFNTEFLEAGADELTRINSARGGRRLPCAVLDRSRAPFDLADFARQIGIEIFDLNDPAWRPAFGSWLARVTA